MPMMEDVACLVEPSLKKWREVYKEEKKQKKCAEKVGHLELDPAVYFNVKRPFFVRLSPEDPTYVRTFRMISYGMLKYSPSLRILILRGAGYRLARKLVETNEIRSIDDLPRVFLQQKLGIVDIVEESFNRMKVNLYECMSCYNTTPVGRTLCDFEAGFIQGVMEALIGKNITREVYCWGLGNHFCGFEVIFE
ncbi:MAG: hypothetical protein J7K48_01890 [Thermococcus sp.]|nr:hypothetical protein [Thermococcus sp.]